MPDIQRLIDLRLQAAAKAEEIRKWWLAAERDNAQLKERLAGVSHHDEIYCALAAYGPDAQMRMLQEECGELIVAVSHWLRGRAHDNRVLAEEIADVQIMCAQISLVIGEDLVDEAREAKWARLRKRLDEARAGHAQGGVAPAKGIKP